jgi:hypothetical protein
MRDDAGEPRPAQPPTNDELRQMFLELCREVKTLTAMVAIMLRVEMPPPEVERSK